MSLANYGNRLIHSYGPIIAERRFEPAGFSMRLGRKDICLALAAADGADLPLTKLVAARMDAIIAAGGGERDWSAPGSRHRVDRTGYFPTESERES